MGDNTVTTENASFGVCFAGSMGQMEEIDSDVSVGLAISENPRNASLTSPIGPQPSAPPDGPLQLAMFTSKFWKRGSILKIGFLAGTDWQKNKVKQYAPQWTQFANLKFVFVTAPPYDVLIDFNPTKGSNSYIGTDSKYFTSRNMASMNLGWIDTAHTEIQLQQVILHEFGHAIGAVHEHESPYATIPWNKPQVYADLALPPNLWNKATVDANMFTLYTLDKVQATAFDPKSIMLYYYPPSWTTDGKGTSWNWELSAFDRGFAAWCYPIWGFDTGLFNTQEIRPYNKPQLTNTAVKEMHAKYESPPRIATALTWLDFDCNKNIRIQAEAKNVTNSSFTVGLNSWADSLMYSAGLSYLELGPAFDYILSGTFSTNEVRDWKKPQHKNTKRINFSRPFEGAPPKVVCFINAMDFDKSKNCRLAVSAKDIDVNGFTANIESWYDTICYMAELSWIAYPSDQNMVASGSFNSNQVRSWKKPQAENSGTVSFGDTFKDTPRLIMGLNQIDYDCSKNLRLRVSTSSVTKEGFVWHLQSWADSRMWSSGASWFSWL